MVPAEVPEPRPHDFSDCPSHTGIDFIKNKDGDSIAFCQTRFQRQHDP